MSDKEASNNIKISKLISNRIETLRPKLLDLTRRNPLISTKFSDRSNSLIRIVDEVPEFLLKSIQDGDMKIVALPDLGTDPKDELSREFQSALAESRLNNEIYLKQLDEIDQQSDEAPDAFANAERALKDRLRNSLNMLPRQTKNNLSLQQHAKNHGISPHFELFSDNQQHEDGRHTDQEIQTLLLPDVLERRLNALISKEKTWTEETGISVLQAAFGFLEWEDGNNSKVQYSPLVLIPVQIEKKRSREGQEFWVSGDDGDLQENKILAEKLRLEFGISLPEYTGQGLEKYFLEVAEQSPNNLAWRVRRWASIGVFPSARLAMYHDLDSEGWDFASHSVISGLFGGAETGHDAKPFGDEYEVDEPEIESKVPYLIADADASQFSTIVDIVNGKNLAVEGPPGTGKSQTIINTIAAALALGMKVLFVAEKSAALEVVRARLEAFGIGEFLLPLLANRTGKEKVISSIRDRIEMTPSAKPADLDNIVNQYRDARNQLKRYINVLSTTYGETDLSVHDILWRGIKYTQLINELPEDLKKTLLPATNGLTNDKLEDIYLNCQRIEESWSDTKQNEDYWELVQLPNINPFQANEILELANNISEKFHVANEDRNSLTPYKIPEITSVKELEATNKAISEAPKNISGKDIEVAKNLESSETINLVNDYLNRAESWRDYHEKIMEYVTSEIDSISEPELIKIREIIAEFNINNLSDGEIDSVENKKIRELTQVRQILKLYEQSRSVSKVFDTITVSDFFRLLKLVKGISIQTLSIRKPDLNDPTIQMLLGKYVEKSKVLIDSRERLKEEFEISSLPDSEILSDYAKVISDSGFFSFLSSDYRKSKKYYKSICLGKKSKNSTAAQGLRQLSVWKSGLKEFCENKSILSMLGVHFDQLGTDFSPFQNLIAYFKEVDQIFQGINYTELRKYLKWGDAEEIKSLPDFDKVIDFEGLDSFKLDCLEERSNLLEKNLNICQEKLHSLKTLRVVFVDPERMSLGNINKFPDLFVKLKKIRDDLRFDENIKRILGSSFDGENTAAENLSVSLVLGMKLIPLNNIMRSAYLKCAGMNQLNDLKEKIEIILKSDKDAMSVLNEMALATLTEPEIWINEYSYSEFSKHMKLASLDKNGLISHSRFVAVKENIKEYGYKNIVESIFSNNRNDVRQIVEALIMRDMAMSVYKIHGDVLSTYNGDNLNSLRRQLQKSDRQVIKLSRLALSAQLYRNAHPPQGNGLGRKSEYTELALLKNEISKKQRYVPVRSLTKRAGVALLELKPCWMMSPLAVAQYLPRGGIEFDLVIIDEASQMTPEDSIGALIRAKQAMVVGDTNQLPPSGFFRKVLDDEDLEEDQKVTEESILEMANASFRPARRLRWHYRSRNSKLIAFSNSHVYKNDLVIFPSAQEDHPDMGVSYVKVNGKYSTGINPNEAKVMVDAIIKFMESQQNRSLGVVLLNQKQRALLKDEMEFALNQNPYAREYMEIWEEKNDGLESFFIKNLENVQGDERDVIFIGTVYGPEKEGGPVMQRFGPINGIAGKRRLNVLFSRAKERIVTFSSMTAGDIRAEEDGNPGVYMLKCWLEYSSTGVLEGGRNSHSEPDSEFEEHVIQQIISIGCEAIPQVGVKGYSIDIGVKHPDWPHGYIMGVECDGATYHSSKSARDRDRLRQEVLEGLGWNLYRIWSTDWFEDPRRETDKLRIAINERLKYLTDKIHTENLIFK